MSLLWTNTGTSSTSSTYTLQLNTLLHQYRTQIIMPHNVVLFLCTFCEQIHLQPLLPTEYLNAPIQRKRNIILSSYSCVPFVSQSIFNHFYPQKTIIHLCSVCSMESVVSCSEVSSSNPRWNLWRWISLSFVFSFGFCALRYPGITEIWMLMAGSFQFITHRAEIKTDF